MINLKVKTLDSQTCDFSVDDEITVRQFKEIVSEKTGISADLQRIIYCGRVLVDEKPLKEYDVNGKVVHVVERPPPSSRTPTNTTNTPNGHRNRDDVQVRAGPIFRALDGMVVGAMTIPVNGGQGQPNIPPLHPSSSFCMNRITVARHMLDCANNIAAFLENPERGLNNASLDILNQGRWTMESTVVEVGISSATNVDLTQNQTQNIMDAFRGAVSAALRQNGHPNVTVLQLPTVFGSNETPASSQSQPAADGAEQVSEREVVAATASNEPTQDAVRTEVPSEPTSNTAGSAATNTTTTTAQDTRNTTNDSARRNNRINSGRQSGSRQRTGTRVLAEVVQNMRTVQTRLEPFIQQYYDILQNDPQFEENDTAGRENSQRIFDRVSEALHYMSHAQHAVSDLMLDLSQNNPRFLCCRPILVEQSGFVSSTSSLASFLHDTGAPQPVNNNNNNNTTTGPQTTSRQNDSNPTIQQRFHFANFGNRNPTGANIFTASPTVIMSNTNAPSAPNSANLITATPDNSSNTSSATTPTADPNTTETPVQANNVNVNYDQNVLPRLRQILTTIGGDQPPPLVTIPNYGLTSGTNLQHNENNNDAQNPQIQVARLIEAVVNSAPLDADLHVQINTPNIVSFGMPLQTQAHSQQQQQNNETSTAATTTGQQSVPVTATQSQTSSGNESSSGTDSDTSQPRVTTATHPTTSTQTRSTARPQVHIASVPPNWNARVIPANMLSSFDRFLPCSSHHIRDSENTNEMNQQAMSQNVIPNVFYRARPQARRHRAHNIYNSTARSNSAAARMVGSEVAAAVAAVASATAATVAAAAANNNNNNIANANTNLEPPNPPAPPTSTGESSLYSSAEDIHSLSNDEFNISLNVFGSNLTLRDLIEIVPSPHLLNRIRSDLLAFIIEHLFAGSPINETSMISAINTLLQMLNSVLIFLPQFDLPDYDSRASVENYLRNSIPIIINLINLDDSNEFGTRFLRELMVFVQRLFGILVTCIGRMNSELYINQIAQMTITSDNAGELEPLRALQRHLMSAVVRQLNMISDVSHDVQEYLVIRRPAPVPSAGQNSNSSSSVTPMDTDEIPSPSKNGQLKDTDGQLPAQTLSSIPVPAPILNTNRGALPTINVGSEPWHTHFPSNWLPIITRDIERQRRQTVQTPFSDAYISGMSAKRRKLVANSKMTDVPLLVAEGVKKAIQVTGIAPPQQAATILRHNNLTSSSSSSTSSTASSVVVPSTSSLNDDISMAIASDAVTQASYCEALRSSVKDRLKTDPDFIPEKFPNSSKYFSK